MSVRTLARGLGLSGLETDVLQLLIEAHPDEAPLLEAQLERATIASRRRTGVGFFLNFSVDGGPLFESPDFELNDVFAELEPLENGAGFMLFIRGGRIAFLEGHSFEEDWPAIEGEHRAFIRSPDRNVH